ncbi:MAG: serine protease [Planctomycetota bacterium]
MIPPSRLTCRSCYAIVAAIISIAQTVSPVAAQTVCLPLPRLLTTMPMGGQIGTTVEIVVTGENIEDASELRFTHPGITAAPKLDAEGDQVPDRWLVTISGDCPPGLHEARLMTRLGISSSRVFCVDTWPEVLQTNPNTSLDKAMPLAINSVCNAVMTNKAVDHYSFEAVKGYRYIINVASRGIDSKLDAVLIVGDAMGRDLVVDRRGGTLDFTAKEDGRHTIKVHELTFKGGPAFYYRLSLQQVAVDAPVPMFASTRTVSSFSWPPANLPEIASIAEAEPNNDGAAVQKISIPCDLAGSFFPAADVDVFEFEAKKGDAWWIEVASERLGRPTDPAILVQRVVGEGPPATLEDVAELTDIAPPIRPSSNGYAYDGPPYDGGSPDIIGRVEIKEDGLYRIQLTDLFGGTRNDACNIYRMIVRRAAPDFAVAAWGLHMELRNGDRNALSKPLALRGGITVALEVAAVRRDGFDGDIDLVMEGLPPGVTAQGLRIAKGKTRGIMLITADQNAPRALSEVSFYGRSMLDGAEVRRPVHMAAHAWPIVDSWGEIPQPRLITGLPISVSGSEFAPLSMAAAEKKTFEVVAGEKLTIPLIMTKRSEFSGSILQLKTSGEGFENNPRFDVSLTGDTAEAVLDTKSLGTQPGDYLISFYGSAVARYRFNPDAVAVAEAEHKKAIEDATAAAAELQKLMEAAAAAPSETKSEADQAVVDAMNRRQAADALVTSAAARLKSVTDAATPRDTVDIVLAEPIAIKVKAP